MHHCTHLLSSISNCYCHPCEKKGPNFSQSGEILALSSEFFSCQNSHHESNIIINTLAYKLVCDIVDYDTPHLFFIALLLCL